MAPHSRQEGSSPAVCRSSGAVDVSWMRSLRRFVRARSSGAAHLYIGNLISPTSVIAETHRKTGTPLCILSKTY